MRVYFHIFTLFTCLCLLNCNRTDEQEDCLGIKKSNLFFKQGKNLLCISNPKVDKNVLDTKIQSAPAAEVQPVEGSIVDESGITAPPPPQIAPPPVAPKKIPEKVEEKDASTVVVGDKVIQRSQDEELFDIISGEKKEQLVEHLSASSETANFTFSDPKIGNHNIGKSLLFYAVEKKLLAAARILLEHGAEVNFIFPATGQTPLFLAVATENIPAVKLLLEYKSDITIVDLAGKQAVEYTENIIIKKTVLGEEITEEQLNSLLKEGLDSRDINLVRVALENHADPNFLIRKVNPLFYVIARSGEWAENIVLIVPLLLEYGSDPKAFDPKGGDIFSYITKYMELKGNPYAEDVKELIIKYL